MKDLYPPFAVLALNTDLPPSEEYTRMLSLVTNLADLGGVIVKQGIGSYNGIQEMSYIIVTNDRDGILDIARTFNQESILWVYPDRSADLFFTDTKDGQRQSVGIWHETHKAYAESLPCYSKFDGRYFVCE